MLVLWKLERWQQTWICKKFSNWICLVTSPGFKLNNAVIHAGRVTQFLPEEVIIFWMVLGPYSVRTNCFNPDTFVKLLAKNVFKKIPLTSSFQKIYVALLGLVWWHINHCKLSNAKSILIHINSFISTNSV